MFKVKDSRFLPQRQTAHSAGLDVKARSIICCHPQRIAFVPIGVWIDQSSHDYFELRETHYIGLYIRSSLAKKGLMLANGTGIIDMDYPNEIMMMIYNAGTDSYTIMEGDRIGQIIIQPHNSAQIAEGWECVTDTREGGFGSTGKS